MCAARAVPFVDTTGLTEEDRPRAQSAPVGPTRRRASTAPSTDTNTAVTTCVSDHQGRVVAVLDLRPGRADERDLGAVPPHCDVDVRPGTTASRCTVTTTGARLHRVSFVLVPEDGQLPGWRSRSSST